MRRTSGPEDFQSSAKKDFFNTICHERTSANFPTADALSIAEDVNLALPKGHSAPGS